jgi:uncharacterized tellurite resistance protein B-like protein
MKLPEQLGKSFHLLCGHHPSLVIRALYDITGELGATWLAVGEERIVFFHRPSGGQFDRLRFQLNEVIEAELVSDEQFAILKLRFATAQYRIMCSLFELPTLNRVATLCQRANESAPIEAPVRLNPASAFCAAIHAVLDADGHVDPLETEWLGRKFPDPVAIEQGSAWLRVNGLDALLENLPPILNSEQRTCLMSNLVGAVMADGLLEPAEQELVERFRLALDINEQEFGELFQVLLSRNQVAVLVNGDEEADLGSSTALDLFAGALVAVTRCDDDRHATEDAHLRRVIPRPDVLAAAEESDAEAILAALPGPLSPIQRSCMLANLLAVAMVDGELGIPEQELIEQFRIALGISAVEYKTVFSVLLAKNNLSVLC